MDKPRIATYDAGFAEERTMVYYEVDKFELDLKIRFLEGRLKYPRSWYYTLKPKQVLAIWTKEKLKQFEEQDKYWLQKCHEEVEKILNIENDPQPSRIEIEGVWYRLTDAGFYDEIDYSYYK